jgi:hypothetical protein
MRWAAAAQMREARSRVRGLSFVRPSEHLWHTLASGARLNQFPNLPIPGFPAVIIRLIEEASFHVAAGRCAVLDSAECLKRADECLRLAEHESDPGLRLHLRRLASAWKKAAEGKFDEFIRSFEEKRS